MRVIPFLYPWMLCHELHDPEELWTVVEHLWVDSVARPRAVEDGRGENVQGEVGNRQVRAAEILGARLLLLRIDTRLTHRHNLLLELPETSWEEDVTTVVGTKGTLRSRGPGLNDQPMMEVHLEEGSVTVPLEGSWFESGFQGTMGELLCSIEDGHEPSNSARDNLRSLELCFAALKSADSGQVVKFP